MQKDYISIFCRAALSHPHVPAVNLFNAFIDSGDDEQKRFAEKNMVLLIRCAEAARSFECDHGGKGNKKRREEIYDAAARRNIQCRGGNRKI